MVRLHSVQSGSGPVIILIHGFLSSSHYFSKFRTLLNKNFTVITLDLLGSGKSPKPDKEVTYAVYVQAIKQTLEVRSLVEPVIMLGHSMGALIAARYAREYPNDVRSLLLFNPPLFSSSEQARTTIEATGRHYRAILSHPTKRYLWRLLKISPFSYLPALRPLSLKDSLRTHHHAREGGYRNIITAASLCDDLHAIHIPTLLVVGKRDRLAYQETLQQLALPNTVTISLIDSSHHPIIHSQDLAYDICMRHIHQG